MATVTDPRRNPGSKWNTWTGEARTSLILLSAVYSVQYLDQIMVGLFVEPIKAEFGLSDMQMGLVTGLSFTLFYVLCGLPLARLADRANRKHIIVLSLALFSAATAACGLAAGFASLFVARVFVAIGEAGTTPASVSILAEHYEPKQRQMTMSIYTGAGFGGTALGLLIIGALSGTLSWRVLFIVAGGLGIILAAIVAWRLREPDHQRAEVAESAQGFAPAFIYLIRIPSFRWMAIGIGLAIIASSSAMSWIPAFLARSHGFSQQQVILFLALGWGGGAMVGTFAFGALNARFRSMGGRRPLIVVGLLVLGFSTVYCMAFLVPSLAITLTGIMTSLFMVGGLRGPIFALVQDIVPGSMQATANATMLFITYAIGAALGPVLTGNLSDWLRETHGNDSLRLALVSVIFFSGIIGSASLFRASRHVEQDILNNSR